MQFKSVPLSKLRQDYITVKQFLEDVSVCEVNSLSDGITNDLGVDGDDAEELLIKFVKQYELGWGDFKFDKHFYSEGEIFGSWPALYNIFILVIKVFAWVVTMLSIRYFTFNTPKWYRPLDRVVSDLTFKQMLVWYIEKEFKETHEILYRFASKSL